MRVSLIFSSPTVMDGTVYVGSDDETLYAVDAATGDQEWAEPLDPIQSSPTVVDGTVYVGSNDGTLHAVDAATGDQEWAFTEPSDVVNSSPTMVDGTVYVGSHDETLYAVDAATGDQEWGFTEPSDVLFSGPTVVADPENGDSIGSRVNLGTLGHHEGWSGEQVSADSGGDGRQERQVGDDEIPGFGIGTTLTALGGAGYMLKRRLKDAGSD